MSETPRKQPLQVPVTWSLALPLSAPAEDSRPAREQWEKLAESLSVQTPQRPECWCA